MSGNFTAARSFIYVAGNVIVAFQNNTNENTIYNQHNAAFNAVTGHQHTGAVGDAPQIGPSGIDLTANYDWTGTHSWLNNKFTLKNPAATFSYIFSTAAIVANRTVSLPLLTGNDEVTMNAASQTLTNKTIPTHIAITNAGNNVTDPVGAQDVVTVAYANAHYIPSGSGPFIPTANNVNVTDPAADQNVVTRKYLTDNSQNNKTDPTHDQDFVTRKYLTDNSQDNKADPTHDQDFVTRKYLTTNYPSIPTPYVSSDLTYTLGALQLNSVPHGLGGEPTGFSIFLIAQNPPDTGFTAGDVYCWSDGSTSNSGRSFSVIVDSTNVSLRVGTVATSVTRADTGAGLLVDITKWKIRLKLWRLP